LLIFVVAEAQKLNKKKKLKGSFGSYEVLPQQKKAVAIDDAQCVAFRLNKASDYQAIHDLLMELRSFYITGEILKVKSNSFSLFSPV
jgi:hypothetical protein